MSERVLIEGGKRYGRRLANEAAFRKALDEDKEVFTGPRNGVWFAVDFDEDGNAVYTALTARPEGV